MYGRGAHLFSVTPSAWVAPDHDLNVQRKILRLPIVNRPTVGQSVILIASLVGSRRLALAFFPHESRAAVDKVNPIGGVDLDEPNPILARKREDRPWAPQLDVARGLGGAYGTVVDWHPKQHTCDRGNPFIREGEQDGDDQHPTENRPILDAKN